jgi:hypothetical protein
MDTHIALQRSQTPHLRNEGAAAWSQIAQQRNTRQQARLTHIPETAVPQTKPADLAGFQSSSQPLTSRAAELSGVVGSETADGQGDKADGVKPRETAARISHAVTD